MTEKSRVDAAYQTERLNTALRTFGSMTAQEAAEIVRKGNQPWLIQVIGSWVNAAKTLGRGVGITLLVIASIAFIVWAFMSLSSVAATIPGWAVLLFDLWLIFK